MQQWYQCPSCGAPVPFGNRFCGNCGQQMNWPTQQQTEPRFQYYCPRCGSPVPFGSRVCQLCGTSLSWPDQQQTQYVLRSQMDNASVSRKSPTKKILKEAGISILGFVLFLSLSVFGVAFLLSQTVLSPGFIVSEVNRLELASLANELIAQKSPEDFPEEIGSAISSTISELEPQLKEELDTAIYSTYDYLLGKRESPELSIVLRSTFLSSDFLVATIDKLDIAPLIKPVIHEQAARWIPQEMAFLSSYIYSSLDELLVNQESWIKEQLKAAADPVADYLVGERQSFNITIPTEPVIDNLREMLFEDASELPLLQLAGLSPELIELTFNTFFNEFSQGIPSSIEIDQSIIGQDVPQQISSSLAEAESTLKQMRGYISYFQPGYILLIFFILLLIAGIALLYREIKGATRTLGIIFLISGIAEISTLIVVRNIMSEQLGHLAYDTPLQLQLWLQQFLNNFFAPWQILSIGFIVAGIVLMVISFVYKSPQRQNELNTQNIPSNSMTNV